MSIEADPELDLEGSRGMMVLLEKQVHLQKEVGARGKWLASARPVNLDGRSYWRLRSRTQETILPEAVARSAPGRDTL